MSHSVVEFCDWEIPEHPKLTTPLVNQQPAGWNIPILNRKYIFKGSLFHCYVSLPKCNLLIYPLNLLILVVIHTDLGHDFTKCH